MFRCLTPVIMCGVAPIAHAQPTYEIGYLFNDEDAVVRTEATPFQVDAWSDSGDQLLRMRFPFVSAPDEGLASVEGELFRESGTSEEWFARGWSEIAFNDVVFESDGSEPIDVGFRIRFSGTRILVGASAERVAGSVFRFGLEVELDGDSREGEFVATLRSTGGFDEELGGFLAGGFPIGGFVRLEGFEVPVNTPVTLRFRNTKSLRSVLGDGRVLLAFTSDRAPFLLESVDGVFSVPDGVTVNSAQAGIRNNMLVPCLPDVDRDGERTIFDFLAFQNLFAAGDLAADFDGDGELTIFDFLAFQNAFDAGCT